MDRAHIHKYLPLKLSSVVGKLVAIIKNIDKQYLTIKTIVFARWDAALE